MFIFKTTRDMRYSSNFLNGLWIRVNTFSPIPKETFKHYKTNKLNKKKQTNKTRKKTKHKMKKERNNDTKKKNPKKKGGGQHLLHVDRVVHIRVCSTQVVYYL